MTKIISSINVLAMSNFEILSLVITIVCLVSFSLVFTILFRNYNLNAIKDINEGKDDIELIDDALLEEKKAKKKKNKILKIIGRVIYYTVYAFVFVFFAFSLTSRIMDNSMLLGDNGFVVIASGSMSKKHSANTYLDEYNLNNQIQTYDIIGITKYKSFDQVSKYDVIAFKSNDGRVIVHRIISLTTVDDDIHVVTRGDASSSSDNNNLYGDYLTFNDIIGYYNNTNIPLVGSFVIFLQSNSGIITIVSIGYCVLMFDYYRTKLDKAINKRTNMLIELINYDESTPELTNYFQQELVYKGYKYIFSEGEFIKKVTLDDKEVVEGSDETIFSKTQKNKDEEVEVQIKDVKTEKIEKLEEKIDDEEISFMDLIKSIRKKRKEKKLEKEQNENKEVNESSEN